LLGLSVLLGLSSLLGLPVLLGLSSLLGLSGCGSAEPPPRTVARIQRSRPRPRPRVRVGGILRLARAGVVDRVKNEKGETVLTAHVPAARDARTWQRAVDTQGNQFRVAPGGRIVPDGEPHPERQPASVANVAYYFAQAYALMAARYRRPGLRMAAEVLDLPNRDPSVRRAQRHFCRLFAKLGIVDEVRRKLYANLVGVAHRVARGSRVINHAHGFGVTTPVAWRMMAGRLSKVGPEATALVLAIPSSSPEAGAKANLMWTTTPAPADAKRSSAARAEALSRFRKQQMLSTPGAQRQRIQGLRPPGVAAAQAEAWSIGPVTYRGRALQSLQLFFTERELLHHVTLLWPADAPPAPLRRALETLLASFAEEKRVHPCASARPPSRRASARPPSRRASARPPSRRASARPPSRRASARPPSRRASARPPSRRASARPPSRRASARLATRHASAPSPRRRRPDRRR
jgi:hypothetical protein